MANNVFSSEGILVCISSSLQPLYLYKCKLTRQHNNIICLATLCAVYFNKHKAELAQATSQPLPDDDAGTFE
ncbi:conserved hypothetical protein [Ricinus communis]|uniref:Uncharacterized protein n=1 Tax=Ricinus communis TaxID=3988 RepID=B9RP87_RICCO|nr:conserved hypothetical protein [Ricinus communis]